MTLSGCATVAQPTSSINRCYTNLSKTRIVVYVNIRNQPVLPERRRSAPRVRAFASRMGVPLANVDKRRERAGESEVMNVIGDVKGMRCILVDDIVDSGGWPRARPK